MARLLIAVFSVFSAASLAQSVGESGPIAGIEAEATRTVVATMAAIAGRDTLGRVTKFADERQRLRLVTYDDANRVDSIRKRIDRVYVDDLLNVAYAEDGRLVSIRFGDGNVWVFSYGNEGLQFVQDRYGAMVTRKFAEDGSRSVVHRADPKGTISKNLERLDALLSALNQQG